MERTQRDNAINIIKIQTAMINTNDKYILVLGAIDMAYTLGLIDLQESTAFTDKATQRYCERHCSESGIKLEDLLSIIDSDQHITIQHNHIETFTGCVNEFERNDDNTHFVKGTVKALWFSKVYNTMFIEL